MGDEFISQNPRLDRLLNGNPESSDDGGVILCNVSPERVGT